MSCAGRGSRGQISTSAAAPPPINGDLAGGVLSDPAVKVVLVNISRGDHTRRPGGSRHPGGPGTSRGSGPDRRAPGRDQRRGRSSDTRRGCSPEERPPREHARGGRGSRRLAGAPREHPRRRADDLVVRAFTGRGHVPPARNRDYGTKSWPASPGEGRAGGRRDPVFDTVARAVAEAGADTSMISSATFRGGGDLEAAVCGRDLVCGSPRDPRPRHANVHQLSRGLEDETRRAHLPRRHLAGRAKCRGSSRRICARARSDSCRGAHARRLPDRPRADATWNRPIHVRGDGGDPVHGMGSSKHSVSPGRCGDRAIG